MSPEHAQAEAATRVAYNRFIGNKVALGVGAGVLVLAGVGAYDVLEHLGWGGIHIDINSGPETATGDSHVDRQATQEEVDVLPCVGDATVYAGEKASAPWKVWIFQPGGDSLDRVVPVGYELCADQSMLFAETVFTNTATGKVDEVKVPSFTYEPYFSSIKEFDPLICSTIPSNASVGRIEHVEKTYKASDGCEPFANTTGAGSNTAAYSNTSELARRMAITNAALEPVPQRITSEFDKQLEKELTAKVSAKYPGVKIIIGKFLHESDEEQSMGGLNGLLQDPDFKRSFTDINVRESNNKLEVDAQFAGASAKIYVDEPGMSDKQLNTLAGRMNDALLPTVKHHSKKNPKKMKTVKPHATTGS